MRDNEMIESVSESTRALTLSCLRARLSRLTVLAVTQKNNRANEQCPKLWSDFSGIPSRELARARNRLVRR